MNRVVLASDFHLSPDDPDRIDLFVRFTHDVVTGADAFYVLGDLFEFWIGHKQLRMPGHERIFQAFRRLSSAGTRVVLFHGNRDFLLNAAEEAASGGVVVGEETDVRLFGRHYLFLHGDSLCTDDVGYQRSKVWMRGGLLEALTYLTPTSLQLRVARSIRGASKRSTGAKSVQTMGIVADAVRERFSEGYDVMVCGHVHDPGAREYGVHGGSMPLYVLGDWHEKGIYAEIDPGGIRLESYPA